MKNYYGVLDGLLLTSLLVFIGTARHFDDSGQSVIRQWPFQRPLPAQNLLINCDNEIEEMQRQQSFLIQDVQSRAKLRDLPEKRFGLAHLLPFFNVNPISEHVSRSRSCYGLMRSFLIIPKRYWNLDCKNFWAATF